MQMVRRLLHITSLLSEDGTSSLLTKVYHKCLEEKKEKMDSCFSFMSLLLISYLLTNFPENVD